MNCEKRPTRFAYLVSVIVNFWLIIQFLDEMKRKLVRE